MATINTSLVIIIVIILTLFICNSESTDPSYLFCNQDTKTDNSTISSNIRNLLHKLVVDTTAGSGFTTASYGRDVDKVYGLAQCRADINKTDCTSCLNSAAKTIHSDSDNGNCSKVTEAVIWGELEYCLLRYDTHKFFGYPDINHGIIYSNTQNVTEPEKFRKKLGDLVKDVRKQALSVNSRLGKGKKKLSEITTLYALAECTRDLPPLYCAQCLVAAFGVFEDDTFCGNKIGCRAIYSSCYVRYELYPFYFPLDPQESLKKASGTYNSSLISNKY